jgi:large subunit ribosomal protein L5
MNNLREYYKKEVISKLMKELHLSNVMEVPKILKITLNMGVGKVVTDKKYLIKSVEDLTCISGQKAISTKAKKSESGFKIRAGMDIGCKVTLRKNRMYDFLERLIYVALPRVRDFRGLSVKAFDKQGNYNLGIKEQIIFPEIDYDKIDIIRGLDINITTSANDIFQGFALLKSLHFPFIEKEIKKKK